ncbi:hypothetical protein NECAME_14542 [Necator americanus]|uniref:Uncharacterized protein n=1 Tax=Necator americanus TaxID=51031 RepID=W2SMP6_NECAM|nr:hypothetical protein NECAME_14542 [Necator americanus]ETN70768.1 hypothetical protein NECAME_14542 [Necator americanus]
MRNHILANCTDKTSVDDFQQLRKVAFNIAATANRNETDETFVVETFTVLHRLEKIFEGFT